MMEGDFRVQRLSRRAFQIKHSLVLAIWVLAVGGVILAQAPPERITGTVRDRGGNPINQVTVEWTTGTEGGWVRTDENGRFSIRTDRTGRFWIRGHIPNTFLPSEPQVVDVAGPAVVANINGLRRDNWRLLILGNGLGPVARPDNIYPRRLNDRGHVVGHVLEPGAGPAGANVFRFFRYDPRVHTPDGAAEGADNELNGINNRETYVGYQTSTGIIPYSSPRMLGFTLVTGRANAVNANDVVVGHMDTVVAGARVTQAAVYRPPPAAAWAPLGTLRPVDNFSSATGINASGMIVGTSERLMPANNSRAFGHDGAMFDLGALAGGAAGTAEAAGINDQGIIVGDSQNAAGADRAVRWVPTLLVPRTYFINELAIPATIGPIAFSKAYDINQAGRIVGVVAAPVGFFVIGNAVLWDEFGFATNLNDLLSARDAARWQLEGAYGMNNSDQIVGHASVRGVGARRLGYLLSPPPRGGGRQAPQVRIRANGEDVEVLHVAAGGPVLFEAADIKEENSDSKAQGGARTYFWSFGDGTTAEEAKAEHAFQKEGAYLVILTVFDEKGDFSTSALPVQVGEP